METQPKISENQNPAQMNQSAFASLLLEIGFQGQSAKNTCEQLESQLKLYRETFERDQETIRSLKNERNTLFDKLAESRTQIAELQAKVLKLQKRRK